mmetsp:Transcript_3386/g.4649  ORF Transcript_3386/g.4649 Transcript_3386/m.4649 type:complete len:383 (+) Transcript_3386:107-1255(+)
MMAGNIKLQNASPTVKGHYRTSGREGFWKSQQYQRSFLDHLGQKLGITKPEDWYKSLNTQILKKNGGSGLLAQYGGSVFKTISSVYPEHKWLPWKLGYVPMNYWSSKENRRLYFDWLGAHLGVKHLDDWYPLAKQVYLQQNGGSGLLRIFNNSTYRALKEAYPEHNWVPWKFSTLPQQWTSDVNDSALITFISEKLHVSTLQDWYRVSDKQLRQLKVWYIVKKKGGLEAILKNLYPHVKWEASKFKSAGKKSAQRWLLLTLQKIFAQEEVFEDYLHPDLQLSPKKKLQLDVFIPSLSLGLEYQGEHHYNNVWMFGPTQQFQIFDKQKKEVCANKNITLVEVPYWWDKQPASLAASILQVRPDLANRLEGYQGVPISASPPKQ